MWQWKLCGENFNLQTPNAHNRGWQTRSVWQSQQPKAAIACACYEFATQPPTLTTRCLDGGYLESIAEGLIGRAEKLPPQFGHWFFKTSDAQDLQKVHSNVQITASADSGVRSLLQHSQLGLSSSTVLSLQFITVNSATRCRFCQCRINN